MSENVVPALEVAGDGNGPGVVIRNQAVRSPGARIGAGDVPALVDLEPLERGLVDGLAGAVAVREVVGDRALVGGRPGCPLQGDCIAGGHSCRGLAWSRDFMADDVVSGEGVWGDEAVIEIGGDGPAYDLRGGGLPLHGRVVTLVTEKIERRALLSL